MTHHVIRAVHPVLPLAMLSACLCACRCGKTDSPAATDAMTRTADKTRPGARVRLTAGDRHGETGVVRGRTPGVPHELYDIVLDGSGDVISSAPERFELVP